MPDFVVGVLGLFAVSFVVVTLATALVFRRDLIEARRSYVAQADAVNEGFSKFAKEIEVELRAELYFQLERAELDQLEIELPRIVSVGESSYCPVLSEITAVSTPRTVNSVEIHSFVGMAQYARLLTAATNQLTGVRRPLGYARGAV